MIPIPLDFLEFDEFLQNDPFTKGLLEKLSTNPIGFLPNSLVNGKLFYNDRFVIPSHGLLRIKPFKEAHSSLSSGHWGSLKTLKCLAATVYWPNVKKEEGCEGFCAALWNLSVD